MQDGEPYTAGHIHPQTAEQTAMKYAILPVTPFQQNCSFLKCESTDKVAIVDPGGDLNNILDALKQVGGTPEKILVTHAHLDHVGAVAELAETLGLPIEGPHRDDQFWIDMLPQQAQMMGFPASRPFTPNRWLEDGDTVTVGETHFEVRHCPAYPGACGVLPARQQTGGGWGCAV